MFETLSLQTLAAFTLASALIEVTPGPNMAYLALISASQGRRAGFLTVAGIALGLTTIGLAAVFGLAGIVTGSPLVYEILRWAGLLFLLYLAVDAWRGADGEATPEDGYRAHFTRGLVTNLLNPKAALFFITVIPAFSPETGPTLATDLVLVAIYVAVATLIHAGIVVAAGAATPLLADERRATLLRRVFAVLLALVAVWFFYATRA
jgi:threonine/homoserine/homoserine lactone efflux protein